MTTGKLASFAANLGYDQIPERVVATAKNCILDCLGVALAGSVDRAAKTVISYVEELGGNPEAGVIGAGFRTCAPEAALANSVTAAVLDYDDGMLAWGGHLTASTLPPVLALGERERASGREVLVAYVAGWEVGAKIGAGIGFKVRQLQWHPSAIVGQLAAAAAASRMLKLDEQRTRIALGIAAAGIGGLRANFGTDTKPFHAGVCARGGVVAALLARKGFTANEGILEGNLGLPKILTHQEWDSGKLLAELGDPFAMISPGVIIKLRPSCALTHRSIDAMFALKEDHDFRAEDVAEIECKTHASIPQTLRFSRPQTATEGKFSMEYCLAAALLDGEVTSRQFTDERVCAPEAQKLMAKVKYSHPEGLTVGPEDTFGPQIVTVKLKNGRQYSGQVASARGEPKNPATWDEISAKFRDCARVVLSPQDVERVIELVSNLDSLGHINELMTLVGRKSSQEQGPGDRRKDSSLRSQ
ncbi:MAG: MmgE/PrpD family protein [Chloroflexi bacterium]|nr:MmgE/PrpD family protein [Chloroflexota bacterium]